MTRADKVRRGGGEGGREKGLLPRESTLRALRVSL